eukprot:SAG31_NODE_922_length_10976_cov_8.838742_8_plen_345_part_00
MLVLALRSLCGCLWLGAARVLAGPHQPSPPAASSNVLSSSGSAGGVLSAADGGVTTSPPQLADVSSDVTMSLLPGSSVNPYYFGFCLESYVGITMGLPLNDTAVMAIAKALHTGVLRYPGGTLSNLFDARTGRYVLPAPADLFPVGTPSCHAGTLGGGVIATQNTTTTSAMAWCNANPRCGGWTAKAACGTSDVVSVDFKDGWGATHHLQKPGYSFWLRGPKGGYPSGYDKWIPWGELTNKLPLGEYSARKYLQVRGWMIMIDDSATPQRLSEAYLCWGAACVLVRSDSSNAMPVVVAGLGLRHKANNLVYQRVQPQRLRSMFAGRVHRVAAESARARGHHRIW